MKKSVYEWLDQMERSAWSRCRVFIILKNGEYVGKIQVAYPKDGAGTLRAFLFDFGNEPQMGTAGGFGYDKLAAALRGMTFQGITLKDHPTDWERQLRDAGYSVICVL